MRHACRLLTTAVVLALFTRSAGAIDLVVPLDFPTIGSAIQAAADGDRVLIEPGS